MKQLSPCGMMIPAAIPFVDRMLPQVKTPQIIHDPGATITSEIKWTTLHPLHIPESFFSSLKTLNINGNRDLIFRTRLV